MSIKHNRQFNVEYIYLNYHDNIILQKVWKKQSEKGNPGLW